MGDSEHMKYLNIELSTLRSAEYVGSSPAERGGMENFPKSAIRALDASESVS